MLRTKKSKRVLLIAVIVLAVVLAARVTMYKTIYKPYVEMEYRENHGVMESVPKEGGRTFYLTNLTLKKYMERMWHVTLYDDGTVRLGTPSISSAILPSCTYSIEEGKLLIYADYDPIIIEKTGEKTLVAEFKFAGEKTLVFQSSTVALFADEGAWYVLR